MAKREAVQRKLYDHWGSPIGEVENEEPLLPPLKPRRASVIIPLTLLILLLAAAIIASTQYLAPRYSEGEKRYQENLAKVEPFEGKEVRQKSIEENCYQLQFQDEETVSKLCVPEELWEAQEKGEPFDIELLRNPPKKELSLSDLSPQQPAQN